MAMKAWRVWWTKMPKERGIMASPSRPRAMASLLATLKEMEYRDAAWPDLRAIRAPDYDGWAATVSERRRGLALTEEAVRREMAEQKNLLP